MEIVYVIDDLHPIANLETEALIPSQVLYRHRVAVDQPDRKDHRRVLTRPFEGWPPALGADSMPPPFFLLVFFGFRFFPLLVFLPFAHPLSPLSATFRAFLTFFALLALLLAFLLARLLACLLAFLLLFLLASPRPPAF